MLLSVGVPRGLAWGREGHRLTALVAQQYLTAEARAQIAELLHGESIADIASWADDRNAALEYRSGSASSVVAMASIAGLLCFYCNSP
jgi:hypothetical protein